MILLVTSLVPGSLITNGTYSTKINKLIVKFTGYCVFKYIKQNNIFPSILYVFLKYCMHLHYVNWHLITDAHFENKQHYYYTQIIMPMFRNIK